ncbi:hypothetical protein C1Y63_00055 [Corynebacterium sp. 13CS0277]|uniref:hypothetical protein n=1 Tax=Corynebacterium sp. 13CS0277 TaxID=2071994 RepID=UPI000D04082B|nr:hypothetical protein [Corynebacterium sp. 13CS0277]PRQ12494.1 hypothetical protein C1Y63_00055 [Corynebacterium sp. 13CS0277]
MTMQQFPHQSNPIERRKQAVRKYTQRGAIYAGTGIVGGIALALIAGSATWLVIGLVVAVVGGGLNYKRVKDIVNYRDPQ